MNAYFARYGILSFFLLILSVSALLYVNAQLGNISSQINHLKVLIVKTKKAKTDFETYLRNPEEYQELSQCLKHKIHYLKIGDIITDMAQHHHIDILSFELKPIQSPLLKFSNLQSRDIKISCVAESDLSIYRLFSQLMTSFPGVALPKNLTLSKDSESSKIQGVIIFKWVHSK